MLVIYREVKSGRKIEVAVAALTSSLRLKLIFRTVPQITTKSPQKSQKHKKSPPHRQVEQAELFYCISIHFEDNLKFHIYIPFYDVFHTWATCGGSTCMEHCFMTSREVTVTLRLNRSTSHRSQIWMPIFEKDYTLTRYGLQVSIELRFISRSSQEIKAIVSNNQSHTFLYMTYPGFSILQCPHF